MYLYQRSCEELSPKADTLSNLIGLRLRLDFAVEFVDHALDYLGAASGPLRFVCSCKGKVFIGGISKDT